MKAFIISGKHTCYFEERPEPRIKNSTDVKVKVKSVGVCGSDILIYEGKHVLSIGHLRIPGHEFAGEVLEVGGDVDTLKPGDRVVHNPISYCGKCYACRHNQGNVCSDIVASGCNCDGGLEEFFIAHKDQWFLIPEWMTWEQATMVEPYTIAAQCNERGEVTADDVLVVQGGGPIGLVCADTALHYGATVILTEIMDGRLQLAKEMGVDYIINPNNDDIYERVMEITKGAGPTVVMDCVGLPSTIPEWLKILAPAGRFVAVAPVEFVCNGSMLLF